MELEMRRGDAKTSLFPANAGVPAKVSLPRFRASAEELLHRYVGRARNRSVFIVLVQDKPGIYLRGHWRGKQTNFLQCFLKIGHGRDFLQGIFKPGQYARWQLRGSRQAVP